MRDFKKLLNLRKTSKPLPPTPPESQGQPSLRDAPNSPADVQRPYEVDGTPVQPILPPTPPRTFEHQPQLRPNGDSTTQRFSATPQLQFQQIPQMSMRRPVGKEEEPTATLAPREHEEEGTDLPREAANMTRHRAHQDWYTAERQRSGRERIVHAAEQAQRRKNSSPQVIRHVRALIRKKYSLDLQIWGYRDVIEDDKESVKRMYEESDVILEEICNIVSEWDMKSFGGEQTEEWQVVSMIQESIAKNRKDQLLWTDYPPWDRE